MLKNKTIRLTWQTLAASNSSCSGHKAKRLLSLNMEITSQDRDRYRLIFHPENFKSNEPLYTVYPTIAYKPQAPNALENTAKT